jgi:hypothetical protein
LYTADEGDETGEMGNFSAKNGEARDCWCQGLGMPVAFDGLSPGKSAFSTMHAAD